MSFFSIFKAAHFHSSDSWLRLNSFSPPLTASRDHKRLESEPTDLGPLSLVPAWLKFLHLNVCWYGRLHCTLVTRLVTCSSFCTVWIIYRHFLKCPFVRALMTRRIIASKHFHYWKVHSVKWMQIWAGMIHYLQGFCTLLLRWQSFGSSWLFKYVYVLNLRTAVSEKDWPLASAKACFSR